MTTVPGYSSRSTSARIQQFPLRDEAEMSVYNPEPGFSNAGAVRGDADEAQPEAAAEEKAPAKKSAKKSSAKKS